MHPFVARWLPDGVSEAQERAYYTVAALIAAQPPEARQEDRTGADDTGDEDTTQDEAAAVKTENRPVRRPNLGHSMAEATNRKDAKHESMERRLQLLARQDLDGIHNLLPPLVRYLRNKKVPVDWGKLLEDLCRWQYSRDLVAKDWLQTYYRTLNDPGYEEGSEAEDLDEDNDDTNNTEE
jgi:CRISPR system Cascade subunit CasB